MGQKFEQRYCPNDQQMVMATRQTPSHILHLILMLLTGGLWAIVWIVLSVSASKAPALCSKCGSPTLPNGPQSVMREDPRLETQRKGRATFVLIAFAVGLLVIYLATL